MPTFRSLPVTVEAVQFTGENWAEMHEFTGHFTLEDGHSQRDVFEGIDPDLIKEPDDRRAKIWVAAAHRWMPVSDGTWIVQGPTGFTPWDPRTFVLSFNEIKDIPEIVEWNYSEPTEPGFYYNRGAAQTMLYLLYKHNGVEGVVEPTHQWYVLSDSTMLSKCEWGYIEQTIEAYPLRRVGT